jgi:hypothetical protein
MSYELYKNRPKCSPTHPLLKLITHSIALTVEKSSPSIQNTFCNSQKLPKVSNQPTDEKLPNLVTLLVCKPRQYQCPNNRAGSGLQKAGSGRARALHFRLGLLRAWVLI